MNAVLRAELLEMDALDQAVRATLAANGTLFHGYHPRMAEVHDAHAARLREIVRDVGWPGESLVGEGGAQAAWRIAQHSINHPDFMRECRALLDEASARGAVPRWQFAYIDDRIRVFEGSPQRYGTQWRDTIAGSEPYPIEDASGADDRRAELGLPSLAELRARMASERHWEGDVKAREEFEAGELAWRQRVGWIP